MGREVGQGQGDVEKMAHPSQQRQRHITSETQTVQVEGRHFCGIAGVNWVPR